MFTLTRKLFAAVATAALAFTPLVHAQSETKSELSFGPGTKLTLAGDSTLHAFGAEATELHGTIVRAPDAAPDTSLEALARTHQIRAMTFTIPVEKLRSGEGGLDKNMWKALKSGEAPAITFRMDSYTLTSAAEGKAFTMEAKGALTIANVARPVTLKLHAFPSAGTLRVIGDQALKMSDFGVTPPAFMGGMMKTKDEVTIRFDLKLIDAATAAKAAR